MSCGYFFLFPETDDLEIQPVMIDSDEELEYANDSHLAETTCVHGVRNGFGETFKTPLKAHSALCTECRVENCRQAFHSKRQLERTAFKAQSHRA